MVLPILCRDGVELEQNQDLQKIIVAGVLSLATIDSISFKSVLGQMDATERTRLEAMLRSAMDRRQRERVTEHVRPSISLRLDFDAVE